MAKAKKTKKSARSKSKKSKTTKKAPAKKAGGKSFTEALAEAYCTDFVEIKTELKGLREDVKTLRSDMKELVEIVTGDTQTSTASTHTPVPGDGEPTAKNTLFNNTQTAPANGTATITQEEVTQACQEAAAAHGLDKVSAVVEKYGATSMTTLAPTNYPNVLSDLKALS